MQKYIYIYIYIYIYVYMYIHIHMYIHAYTVGILINILWPLASNKTSTDPDSHAENVARSHRALDVEQYCFGSVPTSHGKALRFDVLSC